MKLLESMLLVESLDETPGKKSKNTIIQNSIRKPCLMLRLRRHDKGKSTSSWLR